MSSGEMWGLIGGIFGAFFGILGGIYGTWCSIKNTSSPKERLFMIKASIICWIAITLFLTLMFVLPDPYRYLLWIPYAILLPLGIRLTNKIQQRIKNEDLQNQNKRE